jgi:hypothetical protein
MGSIPRSLSSSRAKGTEYFIDFLHRSAGLRESEVLKAVSPPPTNFLRIAYASRGEGVGLLSIPHSITANMDEATTCEILLSGAEKAPAGSAV